MGSSQNEKDAFLTASLTSVLAGHQWFMMGQLNNDEYFPSLKLLVTGLVETASSSIDPQFGEELEEKLRSAAKDLFVRYWLELAREGDDMESEADEIKAASISFNEHYDSISVEYEEEPEGETARPLSIV